MPIHYPTLDAAAEAVYAQCDGPAPAGPKRTCHKMPAGWLVLCAACSPEHYQAYRSARVAAELAERVARRSRRAVEPVQRPPPNRVVRLTSRIGCIPIGRSYRGDDDDETQHRYREDVPGTSPLFKLPSRLQLEVDLDQLFLGADPNAVRLKMRALWLEASRGVDEEIQRQERPRRNRSRAAPRGAAYEPAQATRTATGPRRSRMPGSGPSRSGPGPTATAMRRGRSPGTGTVCTAPSGGGYGGGGERSYGPPKNGGQLIGVGAQGAGQRPRSRTGPGYAGQAP